MQQTAQQLGSAISSDTTRQGFLFRTRNQSAAYRAVGRHPKLLLFARALRFDDLDHFWNHVATAFNQDIIADLKTQPFNLVFVVERGTRHPYAAKLNWLKHRDRRQRSRTSDLNDYVVYFCHSLSRC